MVLEFSSDKSKLEELRKQEIEQIEKEIIYHLDSNFVLMAYLEKLKAAKSVKEIEEAGAECEANEPVHP